MKRYLQLLSLLLVFGIPLTFGLAQTTEEELDSQMLEESPDGGGQSSVKSNKQVEVFGFIENENYFGATGLEKMRKYEIAKNEGRVRLNVKAGTDFFYAKAVGDLWFYPERDGIENPRKNGQVEMNEIYLAGGENFRFKLGKQLFGWGSADAFNVTNYFDQSDLRELFAADKDDRTRGVYAGSLKYIFGEFSAEAALVPVFSGPLLPPNNSFWQIQAPSSTGLPVDVQNSQPAPNGDNVSGAVRFGGTLGNLDFHLSYYNGIDPQLQFKPDVVFATTTYKVLLAPLYERVQMGGLDMAFNLEKLSLRAEVAYTHDKPAIVKSDSAALSKLLLTLPAGTNPPATQVDKQPFIAYTVGADYNLWGDNGRVLLEWTQSQFLKNESKYEEPFLTNILLVSVEDKFFDERLGIKVGGMVRPHEKAAGVAPTGEISWDFQNGMLVSAGGMAIVANSDRLFEPYEDNDFVFLKAKMEF